MLQKLTEHITIKLPYLKEKKILIAISGGIDSVVLTHLLHQLNFDISLAHCNFSLREKESNSDEKFVKKLGQKLKIKTFTTKFNTAKFAKENKQSIQIAARNLRYNWFKDLAKKYDYDYLLTAHHADDNLETFLINLSRGTGLDGLTGIPEKNDIIVRPLLPFSSDDILNFAKENGIEWREDQSNSSIKYTRNKIRHQVVPILKELNPSLLETFAKTTEHLKESQQIIDDSIKKISSEVLLIEKDTTQIDIQKINQLSNPKAYLFQLLRTYNFTEWNDIYHLLSAQSGKQLFSKTHTLLKDRESLLLYKNEVLIDKNEVFEIHENQTEILNPIHLKFEEVEAKSSENKQVIYLDKKTLSFPLKLRKWQKGDFFYPFGMKGKKKVSKYFKDEKFSLLQKQNTWLLCNKTNEIIWIIGFRQDNRFVSQEKKHPIFKVKVT